MSQGGQFGEYQDRFVLREEKGEDGAVMLIHSLLCLSWFRVSRFLLYTIYIVRIQKEIAMVCPSSLIGGALHYAQVFFTHVLGRCLYADEEGCTSYY